MKDDTELDDGILRTALARAVDAQPVRETPFEASRVALGRAVRPSRFRFALRALAAAAVVALTLGVAATLAGRRPSENPAATESVATPPPAATTELVSPPIAVPAVPMVVYFARPGLPPVAGTALGSQGGPANEKVDGRISSRIGALWGAHEVPAGARNLLTSAPATGHGSLGQAIKVDGDTATVDLTFDPPLAATTVADAQGIVQQLVYTITEEPGVRRVALLSDGKPMLLGGYHVPTTPLAREDVSGYATAPIGSFDSNGASIPAALSASYSVDSVAPGLTRVVIDVGYTRPVEPRTIPRFTVVAYDHTQLPGAKAELEIMIPQGTDGTTNASSVPSGVLPLLPGQVDRSPLRSVAVGHPNTFPAQVYRLGLDDLRPWRAVVRFDPTRIVIDIGGPPSAISADQSNVVYAPTGNAEVGHTFTISGVARAYEGTVNFRVRDARTSVPGAADGPVLLYGYAKASVGSSSVYGAYDATVTLPDSVPSAVLLEVFEVSPKDGTETSKVTIPLRVR